MPWIYFFNFFLILPHISGQLQLQFIFGHTNFLHTVKSSISVFFWCHTTLFLPDIYLPFLHHFQEKSPVLAFCLHYLISSTWELSTPVPLGGHFKKLTSTDAPQHLQKTFSQELYLLNSWTAWTEKSVLLMTRIEVLLARFVLSTEVLSLITLWLLRPRQTPISTSLIRSTQLTSSR